ncbi:MULTISPECIES: hypothetical protein [Actinosynnema]|uniref:hypothetical protein n=1 Tax=Actinosynnema TaxID=40566 RepID=UPI0020A54C9B|nr:hypothetical protein [Actinosynnema pretiosum]MCP2097483.1 hypothetical protein [Actinosynnema pretiosum]
MWNEILGALAILGMVMMGVVVLPAAPKLVDAICDRIRYGTGKPFDDPDDEQEQDEEPAVPTVETAVKPVATAKPAATRTAA